MPVGQSFGQENLLSESQRAGGSQNRGPPDEVKHAPPPLWQPRPDHHPRKQIRGALCYATLTIDWLDLRDQVFFCDMRSTVAFIFAFCDKLQSTCFIVNLF